ncbi:MAG: hypothetical protein QXW94_02425 [Desulfurococcaceae archaeon]
MSYIGVDDKLLSKHCRGENNICTWSSVVLVSPFNSNNSYIFDCSFYLNIKKEYSNYPDARLLLSFKSPLSLGGLWFTNQMNYAKLPSISPCSRDTIEEYIKDILGKLQVEIASAEKDLVNPPRALPLFRSVRSEQATGRGKYFGLRVKEGLIKEILSKMGYDGSYLRADTRNAHVLYSINIPKRDFHALVCNKGVKLGVYKTIIDVNAILAAIKG